KAVAPGSIAAGIEHTAHGSSRTTAPTTTAWSTTASTAAARSTAPTTGTAAAVAAEPTGTAAAIASTTIGTNVDCGSAGAFTEATTLGHAHVHCELAGTTGVVSRQDCLSRQRTAIK